MTQVLKWQRLVGKDLTVARDAVIHDIRVRSEELEEHLSKRSHVAATQWVSSPAPFHYETDGKLTGFRIFRKRTKILWRVFGPKNRSGYPTRGIIQLIDL